MITWFLVALLFSPPLIVNSYITSSLIVMVASFAFIVKSKNLILPPQLQILLAWFPFLVVGAFVPMYYGDPTEIWNLRYFLFPLTSLSLIAGVYSLYLGSDIRSILESTFKIFIFFLLFDSLLAVWWILDRSSLGFLSIYNTFSSAGFDATNYWRYIGIYGNPNFDAVMFGYGLLLTVSFLMAGKKNRWLLILIPSLIFGLFATLSRSVMASLILVPIILFFLSIHKLPKILKIRNLLFLGLVMLLIFTGLFVIYLFFLQIEWNFLFHNIDRLGQVVAYFENERFKLLIFYLNYFYDNVLSLVFGNFSYRPDLAKYADGFTDNDYLYMVLKYGVIGALLMIWIQINCYSIGCKLERFAHDRLAISVGKYLRYSAIFTLIVALASVPFSNPKIFYVQLSFYILGMIFYKKLISEKG